MISQFPSSGQRPTPLFLAPGARPLLATLLVVLACGTLGAQDDATRPDYRQLQFPDAPTFEPAKTTRRVLDNGMVLYVLEDQEFPIVSISVTVHTGGAYEPADKVGLAALTGELMRLGGTVSLPPESLDRTLEDLASSVETSIGSSSGSASAWTLRENLEQTTQLLADVLRRPRFAQDKLDLLLGQLRSGIQTRNDDAGEVTGREFGRLLYGRDHPLARVQEFEHLANITRDDIVAFHEEAFVPGNMVVGVVGAISAEDAVALIERHFGDWKGAATQLPTLPDPAPAQPGVYYADLSEKGVTQTVIRIGHLGVRRDNPDYPAVMIMNYMLGGGGFGVSRLLREVRTKRGLAYSAYSSFRGPYDRVGVFFAGCETKSEKTVEAIEVILAEIERIRSERVSEEELEAARREILNSEVFNYDSGGKILSRAILYEYYDYPQDLLEQTLAALRQVTTEQVQEAAKKYLKPDQLVILAVGDSSKFDQPLGSLGRGAPTTLDISIPVPTSSTETLDWTDAAARTLAGELAAQVVEATGGAERIRKTRSARIETKISRPARGGMPAFEMQGMQRLVAPDKVRYEVQAMGQLMVMVASPEGGWMMRGGTAGDLPPAQNKDLLELAGELNRSPWLRVVEGELEAVAGAVSEKQGRSVRLVGIKEQDRPTIYHVDVDTGDVLRSISVADGARTETVFSDFQVVDGRRIAMTREQYVNGDLEATLHLQSVEYNAEIDEAIFVRP